MLNNTFKPITFLSKENIVVKHNRNIKISFIDLTPYIH